MSRADNEYVEGPLALVSGVVGLIQNCHRTPVINHGVVEIKLWRPAQSLDRKPLINALEQRDMSVLAVTEGQSRRPRGTGTGFSGRGDFGREQELSHLDPTKAGEVSVLTPWIECADEPGENSPSLNRTNPLLHRSDYSPRCFACSRLRRLRWTPTTAYNDVELLLGNRLDREPTALPGHHQRLQAGEGLECRQ